MTFYSVRHFSPSVDAMCLLSQVRVCLVGDFFLGLATVAFLFLFGN